MIIVFPGGRMVLWWVRILQGALFYGGVLRLFLLVEPQFSRLKPLGLLKVFQWFSVVFSGFPSLLSSNCRQIWGDFSAIQPPTPR